MFLSACAQARVLLLWGGVFGTVVLAWVGRRSIMSSWCGAACSPTFIDSLWQACAPGLGPVGHARRDTWGGGRRRATEKRNDSLAERGVSLLRVCVLCCSHQGPWAYVCVLLYHCQLNFSTAAAAFPTHLHFLFPHSAAFCADPPLPAGAFQSLASRFSSSGSRGAHGGWGWDLIVPQGDD